MTITQRPSLSVGQCLTGLPSVVNVYFSDSQFEIYGLGRSRESELLLISVKSAAPNSSYAENIKKWWKQHKAESLKVEKLIYDSLPESFAWCALLTVSGCQLDGKRMNELDQKSQRRLLRSMLLSIKDGRVDGLFPDFDPFLLWINEEQITLTPILPIEKYPSDESEAVRIVASYFYTFITGVKLHKNIENPPSLKQWSKHSGEELSRLVDRCIRPNNDKMQVKTLSVLAAAVETDMHELGFESFDNHIETSATNASRTGLGLNRVAGMTELKALLIKEVITPIRNPEPYKQYGLSIPNGILLYGPPGCGKTYIARQLAEELGHYFVEIIPSEIASPFIHQSVVRIRELFDVAAENAPSILFIDEFEALAPSRSELGGHQQYKSEEVNEFLTHLNSCSEKGIFVIAATNRPEKIDSAVRRSGRLDKHIYVGPPDLDARTEMLTLYLEGRPVEDDLDVTELSKLLDGYSSSDIQLLVDESARDALFNSHKISKDSFLIGMKRVRPSVPAELESDYRSIEQRGM